MIFLKEKETAIIKNAERGKKDYTQVRSSSRSDSRVPLTYHQLESGRVTHGPHRVSSESWPANGLATPTA